MPTLILFLKEAAYYLFLPSKIHENEKIVHSIPYSSYKVLDYSLDYSPDSPLKANDSVLKTLRKLSL